MAREDRYYRAMDSEYFQVKREKAKELYTAQKTIFSPYFNSDIVLNSDGFHHLQFSARRERPKEEQVLKFTLLPLGLKIIKLATTLQEYRKLLCPIGEKSHGEQQMKMVEWWGFVAIFVEHDIKVRVVLRKVGNGNITFWSTMPYSKLRNGDRKQKLFTGGIEDD
jgi:hypothetical protein